MKNVISVPCGQPLPNSVQLTAVKPIPAGSILRIKGDSIKTTMSVKIDAVLCNGKPLEVLHSFDHTELTEGGGWNWYIQTLSIITVRVAEQIPEGGVITLERYGQDKPFDVADAYGYGEIYSELEMALCGVIVPDVRSLDITAATDTAVLTFTPAGPSRIEAYLKPDGSLQVQYFDAMGNPTVPDTDMVTVQTDSGQKTVQLAPHINSSIITGINTERATVTDNKGRSAVSNRKPVLSDGKNVYFGEIHWHTEFSSDGSGDLSHCLMRAKKQLGLDFATPGDHIGLNGVYRDSAHSPQAQAEVYKAHNKPGEFAIVPTGELSGRYGHANIVADTMETFEHIAGRLHELQPVFNVRDRYPIKELEALCPEGKAFIIPHHTNMDSYLVERAVRKDDGRPYWCAMNWELPACIPGVRAVEMVQNRGSFEQEEQQEGWRMIGGGLGGSVRTALIKGYRLGFTGGTDNHMGWPTRRGKGYGGITAVIADTLDTKSVFDALYNRHCYATTGARIIAEATLNGQHIGSELILDPLAERRFDISVNGTAPITQVDIIHCGIVLHSFETGNAVDFKAVWYDKRPGRPVDDCWYYVRGRQADGECFWLSPWWIDHN